MSFLAGCSSFRLLGVAVVGLSVLGGLSCSVFEDDDRCFTGPCSEDSERAFTTIYAAGFAPPQSSPANPDACNGVGADGEMRMRFVLGDRDGKPIRLGEAVNGRSVELTGDSIAMHDSALMEVADGGACTSGDACSPGFTCDIAPGLEGDASLRRCVRPDDGLAVINDANSVQFLADNNEHQVYGLLMENSGSLSGWNPPGSQGAWDKNADGDTSDPEDAGPQTGGAINDAIATDHLRERFGAVRRASTPWITAHQLAESEERDTYFGLWSFNETRVTPSSHVEDAQASSSHWTNDASTVIAAISNYESQGDAEGHRANVYEAIKNVIEDQYSTPAMEALGLERAESVDKQLVVFVDGYDDMRENDDVKLDGEDGVIEAAVDNNVRLFIVHLDSDKEVAGERRDDPMYPSGQQVCDPSAADNACKNYEACTRPRGYDADGDDTVDLPQAANYELDQAYCIPRRDDVGRTGPIDDYARLACATGGGYMYVPSADAIAENLSWTPLALDGLWEAKVASGAIRRGDAPTGAPLRVHTEMSVTVAGQSNTYPFSQNSPVSAGIGSSTDAFDNRGVVFTAEE